MKIWLRVCVCLALATGTAVAQDEPSSSGVLEPKESFPEAAPERANPIPEAVLNGRQQRLREHHLEVPIAPLPPERQAEAAPIPPPETGVTPLDAEAFNVSILQNRALSDLETNNSTSTVCEPTVAHRGQEVLYTGNWFAAFSRNGGASFQYRNPATTFPAIPNRPFCCDQSALYIRSHDMMVWFLQYVKDGTGNTVRIAVASGSDIPNERWRYYDFTPQGVGNWTGEWFDYPEIASSANHLYLTLNSFSLANQFRRSVAIRIPLNELRTYSTINYRHFSKTDVGSLRPTQNAAGTMYIGTHGNMGSLRVFGWSDASTSFQTKNFTIQSWHRGGASAPGPDGRDWLGFVDGRITGAWTTSNRIGFAWTSAQGGSFARPNIRVALLDWNAGTVAGQPHIWNSNLAFAYPAAAANAFGQVGVAMAYGGGSTYPSHACGTMATPTSWSLVTTASGTHGPEQNRWGDYMSVRLVGQTQDFACTGFAQNGGSTRSEIVPRIVRFRVGVAPSDAPEGAPIGAYVSPDRKGPRELILDRPAGNGVGMGPVANGANPLRPRAADAPLAPVAAQPTAEKEVGNKFVKSRLAKWDAATRTMGKRTSRAVVAMRESSNRERLDELADLPPIERFVFDPAQTVCEPDLRQQQTSTGGHPWSANCQLVITLRDGSRARGTGWFYTPRLVVTAGHCVHEGEGGQFYRSLEVIPGMNGSDTPFGSKSSAVLMASEGWKTTGSVALDYGAILLPEEFALPTGVKPGVFGCSVLSDADLNNLHTTISGYPGDKPMGTQWFDQGPIQFVEPKRLRYMIDTFGGHSGSAVYRMGATGPEAVGIHNYGGCPNKATRITPEIKAELDRWASQNVNH